MQFSCKSKTVNIYYVPLLVYCFRCLITPLHGKLYAAAKARWRQCWWWHEITWHTAPTMIICVKTPIKCVQNWSFLLCFCMILTVELAAMIDEVPGWPYEQRSGLLYVHWHWCSDFLDLWPLCTNKMVATPTFHMAVSFSSILKMQAMVTFISQTLPSQPLLANQAHGKLSTV